jgi:hypothetical protein
VVGIAAAAGPRVQAPNFQGEIRDELDRLRDNDLGRVIDALGVRKDAGVRLRCCTTFA